jgi:RNA polymerase sigma-70 factor (ECF subfamily)
MKDDILVEQTLAGDKQAFNSLITDYYADIYSMILSWVKNPEDAKDLTQDIFISAYLDLPSLKDHKLFYSWIRQIARHKCQNWKRKQIDFIPLDNNLISREPSADEVLILREMLAKVMEAINSLPESEKRLLKEHYLDDVSYDELESRHGVSAKVLVMRLVRARRKVKNQLEKTLSAFVAFLHDHTESIVIGGTEIVKLGIKANLIVGGVVLLFMLGGTGVLVKNHYIHDKSDQNVSQVSQESYSKSPAKSVSSDEKSYNKGAIGKDKKEITNEKIQVDESKTKTLAINEAKGNESVKDTNPSKASGKAIGEEEELTPEVKQKVEVYTELASLLPEFKYILLASQQTPENANKSVTHPTDPGYEQFVAAKLHDKIIRISEPYLDSSAIIRDGKGDLTFLDMHSLFTQMGKYLGKELPFEQNMDYFSAKDYQDGLPRWYSDVLKKSVGEGNGG